MKPRLLDLFCGAGGAAVGYHDAGFDVVGVDIKPQPNYPFGHLVMDAMEARLDGFDAVHASPPCQHYANVTRWTGDQDDHPALIAPMREKLNASGLPWVMENVRTKELNNPVMLCGSQFGLPIRRHRYFEASFPLFEFLEPCRHRSSDLAFEHKAERAYADAMGCSWMTAREGREAIPPVYTRHLGTKLMSELERSAV